MQSTDGFEGTWHSENIDGVDVTGANSMNGWTLINAPPGTKLALGLARGVTATVVLAAP